MYSFQSTVPPNFDENQWVVQIYKSFDDVHEDAEMPVIFSVPKILMASDPNSYVPQQIALGPYHYWRPELYEMERYKIGAAKIVHKHLDKSLKFQHLVDHLKELDSKIRACYDRYLDFKSETLALMMAVDASFLLVVLQVYLVKDGKMLTRVTSQQMVDFVRRKSAHNVILRDIAMLENQIPLFVLQETLEFQFPSLESKEEMFVTMLMVLCKELSPFKNMGELPNLQVSNRSHVLDLLYHMIVPKCEQGPENVEGGDQTTEANETKKGEGESFGKPSHVRQLGNMILKILSKLNKGPVRLLKKLLSKPTKVLIKLPWKVISKLPGVSILKQPINFLFFNEDKEDDKPENEDFINSGSKPPLVEEISIPSVTELLKSGVCFIPAKGGINDISFDAKTFNFYLPVVSLDVNTEVILRNLVAYEACSASGPLVFTRYTELMNGIIDTVEDAKLLREKGIIVNRLKRDEEVADLWNGMSKSLKLTKVHFLDKAIDDVNKFHSGRWRV